ncbi:hypothetical protein GCM10023219_15600 [Stakelama sediminis]|uniref:Type II secretion system protein J n=1 Tax=Stakelama sediminis TaxID=463200 RepID=A0A840YXL8_9SPHN|nr:type II secretion system minor pseudopilin GspJ [Stakelama sediminis]MBB5718289.1 general secretion pathway protein J [Stakelama sediminis]
MMPDVPASQRGFTLVEMLVALVVFALLASAGVGLLRASVDTQSAVAQRLSERKGVERLRLMFTTDLGQAVDRPTRDARGANEPAFAGDQGGFMLVRGGWSNVGDAPRSDMQRVYWRFDGDHVTRAGQVTLDGSQPRPPIALADAASATMRYRGADGVWYPTWPVQGQILPVAVELTMQAQGQAPLTIIATLPPGPRPVAPLSAEASS